MADRDDLEQQIKQQDQRIEQLENTIAKMLPTRRDALKALAAGGSGAALAYAATGGATAGSDQKGVLGNKDHVHDIYAEDFYDDQDNEVMSFPGDGSVSIEQADITNETAVYGYLSTDQSLTSGTDKPVGYDSEVHDRRNEFDPSTGTFSPDKSGLYRIEGQITLSNISDNDEIQYGFGTGFDIGEVITVREGATLGHFGNFTVQISADGFPLDSGSSYKFFVVNDSSNCEVPGLQRLSWFTITKSVVSEP